MGPLLPARLTFDHARVAGRIRHAALPDIQFEPLQFTARGDIVVARIFLRGTHRGEFSGIPATGRAIAVQSAETFRLADGKVVEQWVLMDALGLLQQLGAVPGPSLDG